MDVLAQDRDCRNLSEFFNTRPIQAASLLGSAGTGVRTELRVYLTCLANDLSSCAGRRSVLCSNNGLLVHWEAPMAGNELAASFRWTDNQLASLSFFRNDNPI